MKKKIKLSNAKRVFSTEELNKLIASGLKDKTIILDEC
jgi:hypothetical protein